MAMRLTEGTQFDTTERIAARADDLIPAKSDVAGGCRGYKAFVDDGSRPSP